MVFETFATRYYPKFHIAISKSMPIKYNEVTHKVLKVHDLYINLVPRPSPFLFFSLHSVQYTEAEEHEKLARPGNTYHVNNVP